MAALLPLVFPGVVTGGTECGDADEQLSAFPDIVTAGTGCSDAEELLASALHVPHCLFNSVTVSANDAAIAACMRLTNSSCSLINSRRVALSAA